MVGAERRDISSGGRHPVHGGDHGLLGGDAADSIVQPFGADRRAPGALERQDQPRGLRGRDLVQQLDGLVVARDDALDLEPRHVGHQGSDAVGGGGPQSDPYQGERRHHEGRRAPEEQFSPQPTAVDQIVGI